MRCLYRKENVRTMGCEKTTSALEKEITGKGEEVCWS